MRPAVLALLSALFSLFAPALAQSPPPPPVSAKAAYESDPKFVAALTEAKQLMRKRDYTFAREAYIKANKISGDTCTPCLESLFDLNLGLGFRLGLGRRGDHRGLGAKCRRRRRLEQRHGI